MPNYYFFQGLGVDSCIYFTVPSSYVVILFCCNLTSIGIMQFYMV